MISTTPAGVTAAMDRAEKSADAPDVLGALPSRGPTRRPVPTNPAWASLPRP
ncbi:MAG: hypothetical protein WA892_07875 [Ornithinimicrobium sp.]